MHEKKIGILKELLLEKSKRSITIARSMFSLNAESQSRARKSCVKKRREKNSRQYSAYIRATDE